MKTDENYNFFFVKILEEQPEIFTNHEVFEIVKNENDIFYTSCRRIALIFEPIKQVISLLESHTANLADCFLEIIQITAAFRRIPTSNNFCPLAIAAFNFYYQQFDISPYILTYFLHPNTQNHGIQKGKFHDICELTVNYYKDLHHSEKEYCVVEDENMHLQELAKTMFAIVPLQAKSMAQIYSFYISNVKRKLKFCDNNFVKEEVLNSLFGETIFAEIDNSNLNINKEENEINIKNQTKNEITIALQDWVDLSDPMFGLINNQEEVIPTKEEMNIDFESSFLV
ncbi:15031_t:CDS:2 [Gigaspora margarita]|uniref:15031_t:CDS:1 n=1 Tax=Gigaspora margarita TaxID=4874 RepID=A0ABN7UUH4_GIGMA|nr:15031_t:CDS:2 [Gigaspora margarita]